MKTLKILTALLVIAGFISHGAQAQSDDTQQKSFKSGQYLIINCYCAGEPLEGYVYWNEVFNRETYHYNLLGGEFQGMVTGKTYRVVITGKDSFKDGEAQIFRVIDNEGLVTYMQMIEKNGTFVFVCM
jgi:hypothetical protein